ncbi:MAG: metallophosphoesterase [Deltaproteobacteria bacterium]|nr:metallophosphoesterase [Deltaproteobacteria bacterium]
MGAPPTYPGLEALDPTSSRLVIVGDTQETSWLEVVLEQNRRLRPHLLAEITRRRPGAVLHLGDLVTWGASQRHWRRLDAELADLRAAHVPVLPVFGNHDRWPLARAAEAQVGARFACLRERPWYAFRHLGVRFVALDSNFGALGPARIEAQARWLDDEVRAADADPAVRAIIGLWHHPAWTNSRLVRPSRAAREGFAATLARSPKTIACFSGHCHAWEHFEDLGLPLFVSGGGGGPRHPLEERPHKRRRDDLYTGGSGRFLHFCELELGADHATVRVVRMRDRAFDLAATIPLPYRAPRP